MDLIPALAAMLALIAAVTTSLGEKNRLCDTPQYLKFGQNGTIECSFPSDFYGVFWYNTTDYIYEYPVLSYKDSVKAGEGYTSGKYDVHKNGSLIIKDVSLEHEQNYTVTCLLSRERQAIVNRVFVRVIVAPTSPFPVIDRCGNDTRICFLQVKGEFELNCSINHARPMVNLTWMRRNALGDEIVSFESFLHDASDYTSRVITVNHFPPPYLLSLYVCKASAPPSMLLENESWILIENSLWNKSISLPVLRYVEQSSTLTLECASDNVAFLVWKRQLSFSHGFEDLLFSIFDEHFPKTYFFEYKMGDSGALIVPEVGVQDEGIYKCLYGGNLSEGVVTYHISVYVNPDPAYPIIEGCYQQGKFCSHEVQRVGTLTCSLRGVRPEVKLEWEAESNRISLSNHEQIVKEKGNLYDVVLTSEYDASSLPRDRITIKCKVSEENGFFSHLVTKKVLLFPTGKEESTTKYSTIALQGERQNHWHSASWIILALAAVCLALVFAAVCFLGICTRRLRQRTAIDSKNPPGSYPSQRNSNDLTGVTEEHIPLMATPSSTDNVKDDYSLPMDHLSDSEPEKLQQFIRELKRNYAKLYDAVQPIPYIRDKLYCVNKVFVEVGMEFLVLTHVQKNKERWEELISYHNILDDTKINAKRRILEGEPGYGKSTITLQFAYDWSTQSSTSILKDVDILIFLRLRQLKGVKSLHRAIKQFLLPLDSIVSERDIKGMIHNCTNLVIILDGYDEYPDQDNEIETDIKHVIMDEMFQESKVILTTRTSCLPKRYSPQSKRIKLTGFSEKARDDYIKKAVVGEDKEAAQKIKQNLEENPVLRALCQVPLFFVMFAHMTAESEEFGTFKSVTSFFRYMVSCFHSHMRNKLTKEQDKEKSKVFEEDHSKLDKLAFDGLTGKSQQISWDKTDMCRKVGHEFYEQYKKIGVLVEEEILEFNDEPGISEANHVKYKTQVRFYHKLFCEWYAAHYLANLAVNINRLILNHTLRHVDPYDLQYFYRFACGLKPSVADKIIRHLKKDELSENFAVLCILEKSGGIHEIEDTVREICSNNIRLKRTYSDIMQWSTVQLLELASTNKIPISIVFLDECFKRFDTATCKIELTTKQFLPPLNSVREFVIRDMGRLINDDEIAGIFKYVSLCEDLKIIRLHGCILPKTLPRDHYSSSLDRQDFQVIWHSKGPDFRLDLESGQWKNFYDDTILGDTDYEKVVRDFR